MQSNRRQFLKSLTATTVGVNLTSAGAFVKAQESETVKTPKNPFSTDPVGRVKLFDGVETSRVGFGTGMAGYNHSAQLTRMDRGEAEKLILHAYDAGVRFFDCADLYGTHEIVTTTLKGKPRDSYTLSTKLWLHGGDWVDKDTKDDVVATVKRFISECKTDYLDLVQIHCLMKPDWDEELAFQRCMEGLEKCKKEGLIRGHGVSCHSFGALQRAVVNPWVDAVHVRLNSSGARMEGTFEENVAVAQKAQDNGKGVICMKLVGEGTMRELEERRKSVEAVVRSQVVDVYIVGFERIPEVDELIDNIERALKSMASERT